MQHHQVDRESLRRLSEVRVDDGLVVSVYLGLDPTEFAFGPARSTAIRSLLDEADRRVREGDGDLSHEARLAARKDVEQVGRLLASTDFEGARGVAVFCSSPADLLESYRLPRPVAHGVLVARSPWVEPLVEHEVGGRWALLLVNRTVGRILRGSRDRLAELPPLIDEVHGQHDQGGWSQARYQRSVEKEVYDHLARVADALFGSFKRSPFDRLLVGCTEELYPEIVDRLHSDLRRRLAGRLQIDVRNPTPEQVLEIAHPAMENDEREHEEELLQRMQQGAGAGGRGAVGVEDVVGALNERRVEALLVTPDFSAEGSRCPTCGWLATDGASRCPAEGTALERLPGLREGAIEAAVRQAAEVIVVRDRPDLEPFGGIGAVLRF